MRDLAGIIQGRGLQGAHDGLLMIENREAGIEEFHVIAENGGVTEIVILLTETIGTTLHIEMTEIAILHILMTGVGDLHLPEQILAIQGEAMIEKMIIDILGKTQETTDRAGVTEMVDQEG